ncbi:MAG: CvpA family protein [Acidimicrobiia bacterium]
MIDLVILVFLGLLLFRGWTRGFVREAMDLVGLVIGTVLAFRLGPAFGAIVAAMSDVSDEVARLIGGFIVFVVVGIGAAVATRAIERTARLPGLNLVNRASGAGLAAAWGVFLATLVLTLGVVLPMPPAVADSFDSSAVTRALTDPDGVAQEVFIGLAGDRLIESVLNLRAVVGTRRVIVDPDEVVQIGESDFEDLAEDRGAAFEIFDLVNAARISAGRAPLVWRDALAEVGVGHATEMYLDGYFAHSSPKTGDVGDRVSDAGIRFSVAGENLALAATVTEVHEGLMNSPGHRANLEADFYDSIGIAVVRGPLGLMVVQVFMG